MEAEKAAEPIRDVFSSEEAYEKARKGSVLEKIHVLEEKIGEAPEEIEEQDQTTIVPTVINRTTTNDIIRPSEPARSPKDKKHDIPHRVIRSTRELKEEQAALADVKAEEKKPSPEKDTALEEAPSPEKRREESAGELKNPPVKKRRKKKAAPLVLEKSEEVQSEEAGEQPVKPAETVAAMSAAPKASHKSVSVEKTEAPKESAAPEDDIAREIESITESAAEQVELPSDEPEKEVAAEAAAPSAEAESVDAAPAEEPAAKPEPEKEPEEPVVKPRIIPSAEQVKQEKEKAAEEISEAEDIVSPQKDEPEIIPAREPEIGKAEKTPAEGEELPKKKKKPAEGEELPKKKKKPAEGGELPKKKKKPAEGGELPKKKKKPAEGEELPKKKKKPAEGGELPKKKKKPAEGEELPRKKKKPAEGGVKKREIPRSPANKKRRFDDSDVAENKYIAALAYIGVLILIPLFGRRDSEFCKAHVRQGAAVLVWTLAVGAASLAAVLGLRALILWALGLSVIVYDILALAVTAVMLTLIFIPVFEGAVGAFEGMYKKVKFVGKYVK